MKVLTAIATATLVALTTACTSVDKEKIHEYAVNTSFELLDKAICKKLDAMKTDGTITQQEYEVFIKELAKGEEKLREAVNKMYTVYKEKKAQKKEAVPTTEVTKVEEGVVEQTAAGMKKGLKPASLTKPKVETPAKAKK